MMRGTFCTMTRSDGCNVASGAGSDCQLDRFARWVYEERGGTHALVDAVDVIAIACCAMSR